MARRNIRIDTESGAQEMLFEALKCKAERYPELVLLHHIPNGGKRDKATAIALKRQGVKAGVPDLCLPVARGGYYGLYIELKVGKNTTTKLQDEWIRQLNNQGYMATVCRGWQEAAELIIEYLESEITPLRQWKNQTNRKERG